MPDLDFASIAPRHRELAAAGMRSRIAVLEVSLAAREIEIEELLENLEAADRKINTLYDLLADARDALAQKQRS